jgi:hypothetical protein
MQVRLKAEACSLATTAAAQLHMYVPQVSDNHKTRLLRLEFLQPFANQTLDIFSYTKHNHSQSNNNARPPIQMPQYLERLLRAETFW